MKLIITGGCGFIGSAVVRQAVARGDQVLNLDAMTYAANMANVAEVADHPHYGFAKVDIRDRAQLDQHFVSFSPDAVIHLAAESHVDRSIDGPSAVVDTNVMGTCTLLEAARTHWESRGQPDAFRFLHVSTDEVFGSLGPEGLFTETSPYAPRSPYAASKAASDHLVRAWHETYGLPILLSNCSNNYGPFQAPEKLIPVVILRALGRQPIPVYGDGQNVRDWLYVDDHADALLRCLDGGTVGRSYNFGGRCEKRNIDLVQSICALMDAARPDGAPHADLIQPVPDRPGHDRRYAIDPARAAEELGWHARTRFEDGLRQTVSWYLNHEDWWRPMLERPGMGHRLGARG